MQSLLAALALIVVASLPAVAQTTGPGAAGSARPARGPEQTSAPNAAPAATTSQTTGARNQNPTVKQMNDSERKKVETFGK